MDFFNKFKTIKLISNHGKYLVADNDGATVYQSRRLSNRTHWLVETVDYNPNVIRIKSCAHGTYLTASTTSFLLGMTGNKVLLTALDNSKDPAIEWEPIKEGLYLKLKGFGGKFLRANGGTPPWRGTVTHDKPATESTKGWIFWGVEKADGDLMDNGCLSTQSSFASDVGSPGSVHSFCDSPSFSSRKMGMNLFHNAKAVRLRSNHMKYLYAKDDEESIVQDKNGSSRNARWTVEFINGADDVIRLKSCHGKYMTASDQPFLLGMTGKKVFQVDANSRRDSTIEWEPIREGNQVKLKTRHGNYLRGNGGLPPWRNSVTHDVPQRSSTLEWILWEVHVVEIIVPSPEEYQPNQDSTLPVSRSGSGSFGKGSLSCHSPQPTRFAKQESRESPVSSPTKAKDGRVIYYRIADDIGNVDKDAKEHWIDFEGNKVYELIKRLERETGIEDLIVCSRSPYNQKLYPIRLQLPPNNDGMHLIVVDCSSQLARDFEKEGLLP